MQRLAWPVAVITMVLWAGTPALAQEKSDPWADYGFLLGEWVGEGEGEPGKASGQFTFLTELDGKVLVRKHRAEVPAAGGRPAQKHEDLLIVYRGADGKRTKAILFDNEEHVIQYSVSLTEDKKSLVFVSDPDPSTPRFRLTYTKGKDESLKIKFEFAPPGKPDEFKTYVEGSARKKAGKEQGN
jgi:hypothetical protein